MGKFLLLTLVLTLGCFQPKPKYFVACDTGGIVVNVVQAMDSADARDLFGAAVASDLIKECRIYRVS